MAKKGIPRASPEDMELKRAVIKKLREDGMSLQAIADKLGLKGASTVHHHLYYTKVTARIDALEERLKKLESLLIP